MDEQTQCPECGAQLIVNSAGKRKFTCGRKDTVAADRGCLIIVSREAHCLNREVAESLGGTVVVDGTVIADYRKVEL